MALLVHETWSTEMKSAVFYLSCFFLVDHMFNHLIFITTQEPANWAPIWSFCVPDHSVHPPSVSINLRIIRIYSNRPN